MIIDHPTPALYPGLKKLWQEAFGDTDEFLSSFFSTAMESCRCFAATEGTAVLGALYWFDCTCRGEKLAYLYAAATAKAYRGRGICHRLMEHTHRHLQCLDYAGTVLVPGEKSLFAFYGKMGYETFCNSETFPCRAGEKGLALQTPSQEEYARLRKALLPPGAVVQEGENLDFLSRQATLYTGNGFVLAGRKEGRHFTALELLGNADPQGILAALKCQTGDFRNFGTGKGFAMYRPLTDAPPPTYFAFAFD